MPAECGIPGSISEAVHLISACIAKRSEFWSCSGDSMGAVMCLVRCYNIFSIAQRWRHHQRCRFAGRGTLQPEADHDNSHARRLRASSG